MNAEHPRAAQEGSEPPVYPYQLDPDLVRRNVPPVLRQRDQFVCWRIEWRLDKNGKLRPTKVPHEVPRKEHGFELMKASTTNPATWSSFEECVEAAHRHPQLDGVGFVFSDQDDYIGVDFDGECVDTAGTIDPDVERIVRSLDSYTELSPSRRGLHVIALGKLPPTGRKKGPFEIYADGRFFTVTGHVVDGFSTSVEFRQEAIEATHAEVFSNGSDARPEQVEFEESWDWDGKLPASVQKVRQQDPRVEKLLTSSCSAFDLYPSESEVDLALANYLARTGCSGPDIVAAIRWRRTTLGLDLKHAAYFRHTVGKALGSAKEKLSHPQGEDRETRADDLFDDDRPKAPNTSDFFTEEGMNSPKLGKLILDEGHLQLGMDGRLFRYRKGVYRPDGDTFVGVRVRQILGDRYRKRHATEVRAWCLERYVTVTDQEPTDLINVANGLLDWKTGELHAHSPHRTDEDGKKLPPSTVQLPVAWNPGARCPLFERYLSEVVAEDVVEFVYEVIGYALYAGNPLRKGVLVLGPGGNGKTVILNTTKAMLGEENVAAVPLQTLSENRFAAAEVFGKLAIICGDLDARAVTNSDTFKKLTGGDQLHAERKYCHPFSFTSYALPIYSANEPPLSSDQSQAWFDRWLVIPMEQRYEDQENPSLGAKKADDGLTKKLTALVELQGLLVRAVAGLRGLMARGHFNQPKTIQLAGEKYRERLDSVRAFVMEECDLGDWWTPRKFLYQDYRNWMKDGGQYPLGRAVFSDHLLKGFPGQISVTTRTGVRGFAGIAVRITQ